MATLLDTTHIHMTIFLPSAAAGQVRVGDEARIVLDAAPQVPLPAKVSFVSAEAQFTPKHVETPSEREKLSYRVKAGLVGRNRPGARRFAQSRSDWQWLCAPAVGHGSRVVR